MTNIVLFAIGFAVGFIVGFVVSFARRGFGVLRIDRHINDNWRCKLEVNYSLEELAEKKEVVLKIDPNADLAQK